MSRRANHRRRRRRSASAVLICRGEPENQISDEDLLFPQWMFAFRRPGTGMTVLVDEDMLLPLISTSGKVYEHGTMGARFVMNCHCVHCKAYAAWYARERRTRARESSPQHRARADSWRRDGSEFLSEDVWGRIWRDACGAAGLPREFTPYNARHTGISWAVEKRVDLGRIRQRAGHGSLEVTSRYQAILDEKDTTLAESLEDIFQQTSDAAG